MSSIRSVFLLLLMAVGGMAFGQDDAAVRARLVDVRLLPLLGPLTEPRAEVSGLTWKGDTLVVLPQNPEIFGQDDMLGFFVLPKADILARLDGLETKAMEPKKVLCRAGGLIRLISGFDGLEAMGIMQDRVYLTVEANEDTCMAGYLVCGHYNLGVAPMVIEMTRLASIPMGVNIPNVAEESMIIDGQRVITFSEANGANITEQPLAKVFDQEINFLGSIPFPQIEYRVTDATALDETGRFWVLNYFYPGEKEKLNPAPDPEVKKFGLPEGLSEGWNYSQCVERLLELRLTPDDRIVRTETPPINLRLRPDGRCRNWEALVRLDDRGFLLMTDKYPATLLAFVPNPFAH